jgi:hypothetical protein
MHEQLRLAATTTIVAVLLGGCGGPGAGSAGSTGKVSGEAPAAGIQPCKLLTAEQVATVLPNHDGGMVAHAGGSLIKGVDAYQCSYSNAVPNIFTVVLNVAVDDERFKEIKPSRSFHSDDKKIDAGDAGWVYGSDDDMKVEVLKGRTVIDLELLAPRARGKSDALVGLARAVAQQIH